MLLSAVTTVVELPADVELFPALLGYGAAPIVDCVKESEVELSTADVALHNVAVIVIVVVASDDSVTLVLSMPNGDSEASVCPRIDPSSGDRPAAIYRDTPPRLNKSQKLALVHTMAPISSSEERIARNDVALESIEAGEKHLPMLNGVEIEEIEENSEVVHFGTTCSTSLHVCHDGWMFA